VSADTEGLRALGDQDHLVVVTHLAHVIIPFSVPLLERRFTTSGSTGRVRGRSRWIRNKDTIAKGTTQNASLSIEPDLVSKTPIRLPAGDPRGAINVVTAALSSTNRAESGKSLARVSPVLRPSPAKVDLGCAYSTALVIPTSHNHRYNYHEPPGTRRAPRIIRKREKKIFMVSLLYLIIDIWFVFFVDQSPRKKVKKWKQGQEERRFFIAIVILVIATIVSAAGVEPD
jgi:hypothetical protein